MARGIILTRIRCVCLVVYACACSSSIDRKSGNISDEKSKQDFKDLKIVNERNTIGIDSTATELVLTSGLVDVQTLSKNILVDLKYAGTDNFTNERLYFRINRAYLQKEVAEKLVNAQKFLDELKPGYHLLVYDAIRPREVQHKMWKALDSIPASVRANFVSNPHKGSIHNYGAAVDVTITNERSEPLDMGADYDDSRKIAYPIYERRFLNTGELLLEHIDNRKLLRLVMGKAGFTGIDSEWWHFNACSHQYAKMHYPIIEEEDDIFE